MAPAAPATVPVPPKAGTMLTAPATIVVSLPADAKLMVDGVATTATSASRTFATPVLSAGQTYHYTFIAEVVRDGQKLTATQPVTVRAGQTSQVEIPASLFSQAVAAK